MTNITGTVSTGTVATTFTGTTNDPVVAGTPFAGTIMAVAPPPPVVMQSLFTTQTPASVNNKDGTSLYELGMKFQAAKSGTITGIRFWKGTSESGTHTGKIYSASGTLLASQPFSGETASGWQSSALATPLSITANTTYVVTVNTPNGFYVASNNGLATQIKNADLLSVVGGNGVYGPVGKLPTTTWQASNYFRDIVFAGGPPPPADTQAPAAPASITATEVPGVQVNVAWTASTDNVAVTGYNVLRNGAKIGTSSTLTYADRGPLTAGQYTYSVSAFDAAGNTSAQSVQIIATITLPLPSVTSGSFPGQTGNPVGFTAAPGYPGSLNSSPPTITSGTAGSPNVYSFYDFVGGFFVDNIHDVTFVGCRFQASNSDNCVSIGASFSTNITGITFSYCSMVPLVSVVASPPHAAWPSAGAGINVNGGAGSPYNTYMIPGAQGYQFNICYASGVITLDHCDIWGFGNALTFHTTTGQKTITDCWFHDARSADAFSDHTDGPGYLDGSNGPPQNVLIRHCTIASIGNTNGIAFQWITAGGIKYANIVVDNNFLSGFNYNSDMGGLAVNNNAAGSTGMVFTNNIFGTDIQWIEGPSFFNQDMFTHAAGANPTNTWANNKLRVLPGTSAAGGAALAWTNADDGKFVWPDNTLHTSDF